MRSILLGLFAFSQLAGADLVVYTDRVTANFNKAAAAFTSQTGQNIVFVEAAYKDLATRLELEKETPQADLIITKDIVYLADLVSKDWLQPMTLTPAVGRVHSFMRDTDMKWVALTYRARTAVYKPGVVDPNELTSYEDLASEKWAGRLCMRKSADAYSQALVAYLVTEHGTEKATDLLTKLVGNMDNPVFKDDRSMLDAIITGDCDVAIVNHYYLAQKIFLAEKDGSTFDVGIKFLNQGTGGVHTNGAGAGILKSSTQAALAQQFIDIMLSDEVQLDFSAAHFDYPAVIGLAPTTLIERFGVPRSSAIPWSIIGTNVPTAIEVIKAAGYQ